MRKVSLFSTGKVWENTEISYNLRDIADLELNENPCNSQSMFGNVQIPMKWKYSVESHIIPRLWVFE